MVNGISSSSAQSMQQMQGPPDPSKMYNDLAQKVGANDKGITQDDLTNYLKKLQDDGQGNSREAKMISRLSKDFSKLSGGSDTITSSSMQEAFKSGSMGRHHGMMGGPVGMGQPPSPEDMYKDLATSVGADDKGISKQNLQDALDKLNQNGQDSSREADLLGGLIDNFDDVSGGGDYITSDSLQKAMQNKMQQSGGPPDQVPSDITSDQVQSPVDLRVI